jgi:hypothetical protein
MSLSLKTLALTGAILLATIGGAFAATIDHNTPVKNGPHNWSANIQWASYGEHVKIVKCQGSYCYVKINGPDGWVKKSAIDFSGPGPFPGPFPGPVGGCFYGPYGYVCF